MGLYISSSNETCDGIQDNGGGFKGFERVFYCFPVLQRKERRVDPVRYFSRLKND